MAMDRKTIEDRLVDCCGVLGAVSTMLSMTQDCGGLTVSTTDDVYYAVRSCRTALEHVIDNLPVVEKE